MARPAPTSARLWLLPLIAGLLPALAAVAAFHIAVAQEFFASCNPFFDGCASISRAGRHGLANHVFRALMLPAATLQGVTWLLCTAWLRQLGAAGRSLRWLPWLGVAAAAFLVLYGSFLGTEGEAYRWMRRYGVVVYFGCTYLCMLIAAGQLRHLAATRATTVPARMHLALLGLLMVTLLMGLANVFVAPLADEDTKNRIENVLEWWSSFSFTVYFCALAWLWRRDGFRATFGAGGV
jgi:uncharacterized membrane protein YqhA